MASQVNRNVHQYTTTVTALVPPILDISWNVNLTILNGVIKPSLTYTETYRSRGRMDCNSSRLFINLWVLMWQKTASFDEDSRGEGMDSQKIKIKKKTKTPRITDEGWNSQKRLSDPVEKKMKEGKRRKKRLLYLHLKLSLGLVPL